MRKEYYLYISLIILFITGIIYYNRPLNINGLTDPGEEYFALPERTLPSSWDMAEQDSSTLRQPTEISNKLSSLDEILANHDRRTGKIVDTYTKTTTGGIIEEIYRDNITTVFDSGDNREVIQYHINNLARYMSGYELYPPRREFATAIPRFTNHQSVFRVGSLYSSLLCHEDNIQACTDNFRTLFKFSQQVKKSGTLISLLIGIVEEGIVINHIEYLNNSDPEKYQFIITMLQSEQYLGKEEAFHNAFISEYNIVKNEIKKMPLNMTQSYDFISIVGGGESRDPTGFIIGTFKWLRIPPKLLFDVPETLSLARSFYYKGITDPILGDEFSDSNMVEDYRTKGHPLLRKNILGYHMLNAIIPRLTGLKGRAMTQETRFYKLINP